MNPNVVLEFLAMSPMEQALALDGAMLVVLPYIVAKILPLLDRRPPNRRRDVVDSTLRTWWRAVYANRARAKKAVPMILVALVTVGRVIFAFAYDLDPIEHAIRGFGTALGAIGWNELLRSPSRVLVTPSESGDVGRG